MRLLDYFTPLFWKERTQKSHGCWTFCNHWIFLFFYFYIYYIILKKIINTNMKYDNSIFYLFFL